RASRSCRFWMPCVGWWKKCPAVPWRRSCYWMRTASVFALPPRRVFPPATPTGWRHRRRAFRGLVRHRRLSPRASDCRRHCHGSAVDRLSRPAPGARPAGQLVNAHMLIAGQVEGVIGIRFTRKRAFRSEEMELAQALAHQAMLAFQLRRLSHQSRQAAVAAERNRMARDIHDTLAQGFTGVIMQLEAAEEAMSQSLASKAEEHVTRAGELAREGLGEARRSVR